MCFKKILARLRGLGEYNNRNELLISEPQCNLCCFIPLTLVAKQVVK